MKIKFEAHLRRTMQGDKVPLPALSDDEELWFRPKKYSVEGAEEIRRLKDRDKGEIPADLFNRLEKAKEIIRKENEEISADEVWEKLPADIKRDWVKYYQPNKLSADLARAILSHGIGEHNMIECEAGTMQKATPELIEAIMAYKESAQEMITIIEGWNLPLPQKKSRKSKTPPSGSIEGQSSDETVASSRTEATHT